MLSRKSLYIAFAFACACLCLTPLTGFAYVPYGNYEVLRIKASSGESTLLLTKAGDLFIAGHVLANRTSITLNPSTKYNTFKNRDGVIVAAFDCNGGDLQLKGNVVADLGAPFYRDYAAVWHDGNGAIWAILTSYGELQLMGSLYENTDIDGGMPVVVQSPASATAAIGATVNFAVTATGRGPLEYLWRKDGYDLPGDRPYIVDAPTLTLQNVTDADAGQYSCRVLNGLGSVISQEATLTVNDPVITAQPVSQLAVNEGDGITLSVTAAGSEDLEYQWYFAGQPLADSTLVSGSRSPDLFIGPAGAGHGGAYYCEVTQYMKTIQNATATVTVSELPGGTTPVADSIILDFDPVYENTMNEQHMGYIHRANSFASDGFTVTGVVVTEKSGATRTLSASSVTIRKCDDDIFRMTWMGQNNPFSAATDRSLRVSVSYKETMSSPTYSTASFHSKISQRDENKTGVSITIWGPGISQHNVWRVHIGDYSHNSTDSGYGLHSCTKRYYLEKGQSYPINIEWLYNVYYPSGYSWHLSLDSTFLGIGSGDRDYYAGGGCVLHDPARLTGDHWYEASRPSGTATLYVSKIDFSPEIVPYQQKSSTYLSAPDPNLDKTYTANHTLNIPGAGPKTYTWHEPGALNPEGRFYFVANGMEQPVEFQGETARLRAIEPSGRMYGIRKGVGLSVSCTMTFNNGIWGNLVYTYTEPVHITPFTLDMVVDGNRDGILDFNIPEDREARFWANNDHDVYDWTDTNGPFSTSVKEYDDVEGYSNCEDKLINSPRDLEDFMRLRVRVIPGDLFYDKVIRPYAQSTDSSFRFYKDMGPLDVDYPPHIYTINSSQANANHQFTVLDTGYLYKAKGWPSFSTPYSSHLIEAADKGDGHLTYLAIYKNTQPVGKTSVRLDIDEITDFYDEYACSSHALGDASDPVCIRGNSPSTGADETYILHVHGWNMTDFDKKRFGETMYKRLWWRGYRGRFGIFNWPTAGSAFTMRHAITYNEGEYRAWMAGRSLEMTLRYLLRPYHEKLYLTAHSQGNVVAGNALRYYGEQDPNPPSGLLVDGYIAMQAALSTHYYQQDYPACPDNPAANPQGPPWTGYETPNVIAYYPSGEHFKDGNNNGIWDNNEDIFEDTNGNHVYNTGERQFYEGDDGWHTLPGAAGLRSSRTYLSPAVVKKACMNFYNFYNPVDWALTSPTYGWWKSNKAKPDGPFHGYSATHHFFRTVIELQIPLGEVYVKYQEPFSFDDSRYRIFSYGAESRSLPLGASPGVSVSDNGDILFNPSTELNLNNVANLLVGYDDTHPGHSKQFRGCIQEQNRFYYYVLNRFNIPQTYNRIRPETAP